VALLVGDGALGLPQQAPFDAINVAAATPAPTLELLAEQLGPGGRLVAPLAGEPQRLVRIRRTPVGFERSAYEEVRFVPLIAGVP
jgi:protein-L-isoaspartate(D-aspartate) O-methyltransferase